MTVRLGYTIECSGIIAIILGGMVTCETVLTSICGSGNVKIWFTCNGNGVGSEVTIDFGPCVGVTGWKRTSQFLSNSYERNLSLE